MTVVNLHSPDRKTHAAVQLEGIELGQYKQLSDALGAALEREKLAYVAVSAAMRQAVELCPKANPADLWVHLIYHQFRNRFARSDQSWKRVSGQATRPGIRLSAAFGGAWHHAATEHARRRRCVRIDQTRLGQCKDRFGFGSLAQRTVAQVWRDSLQSQHRRTLG